MKKLIIRNLTPKADGFRMPAEFEEHDGTFMIFPWRAGSWGKDRSEALEAFGKIFSEILKHENLYLFAGTSDEQKQSEMTAFISKIESNLGRRRKGECFAVAVEADDAWARDTGATMVIDRDGNVAGVNWSFNAWGGEVDGLYSSWNKDDRVAKEFCRIFSYDCFD